MGFQSVPKSIWSKPAY